MKHYTSTFQTSDGTELFTQSWTVTNPLADLVLIHGLAEHSSRYQWVAETFNETSFNVHSFDLRGHGKSGGNRAFISSFDQYINDVHLFLKSLDLQTREFFILGHSMGGLMVTNYLAGHPEINCKGAILSAPALKIGDDIPPLLVKLSSLISSLFPTLKTTRLNSQYVSRDPEVVESYNTDPFIYHDGIKARLGYEMIKTMKNLQNLYSDFKFPVLIMHGTADKLADPQGSRRMYDEIAAVDKKLIILPGFYHEILNEPEKTEVVGKIVDWMKKRS